MAAFASFSKYAAAWDKGFGMVRPSPPVLVREYKQYRPRLPYAFHINDGGVHTKTGVHHIVSVGISLFESEAVDQIVFNRQRYLAGTIIPPIWTLRDSGYSERPICGCGFASARTVITIWASLRACGTTDLFFLHDDTIKGQPNLVR